MTLSEATAGGYSILSGPYRIPHQEVMLLKAIDSLGNLEHRVALTKNAWYIVRKHMLPVDPETEIPEPSLVPTVKVSARISDEAQGLLVEFAHKFCSDNYSQALDIAVLGFFKVKKVTKLPKLIPCLPLTPPSP